MNKLFIGGIVAIFIVVGGLYIFTDVLGSSAPEAASITWQFTPAGVDEATGAEKNTVTVTVNGISRDAGTYLGSCQQITGTEALLDNELSGVLCWFAGGGDEVGVFTEGSKLVVKHGEVGEPTAETAAFRGNFTTLFEVAQ